MSPGSKSGVPRIALAAFVVAIAWLTTARADDILDRRVRFHISASPLASALIEFSTQSGIKVAAADADVSQLNSNGVNGPLPIRAALSMLLHGSGLTFSRVGAATVAIRTASAGPAIGTLTRASGTGAAPEAPAAKLAQPDLNVDASASPLIPDVIVTTPRLPTHQELAGDSLHQFVLHHATVHYVNVGTTGNLAHWRGGRSGQICPLTLGLDPAYNAFVTARLRAIAAEVGAPVQPDLSCNANVRILFTTDPRKLMKGVEKWASVYFRRHGRYTQMRPLIGYGSDHAIQGWYITTAGGWVLNADLWFLHLNLWPLWPQIIPNSLDDDGDMNGIGVVILAVDTTKVAGYAIGTIADYVAMLSLSVVQSPNHCDPLPSILDVMSSGCGTRAPPTTMTAGDLAFLKALYDRKPGPLPSPTRDEIQYNMLRQLKGQ
jgi:hypothetical protein